MIVVLADLAPLGSSADDEEPAPLVVRGGDLGAALRRAHARIELDVDDDGGVATAPTGRRASVRVDGARAIDRVLLGQAVPLGARLASARRGLAALRAAIEHVEALRVALDAELGGASSHRALRHAIAGADVRAADTLTRPRSPAAGAALDRLRDEPDARGSRLLDALFVAVDDAVGVLADGDALRLGLPALVVEALRRGDVDAPVGPVFVDEVIAAIDAAFARVSGDVARAPATRAATALLGDLEAVAAAGAFDAHHVARADLARPSRALVDAIAQAEPHLVVTPHALDPDVDAPTIAAWAAIAARLGAVFAADAPVTLAADVTPSDRWRRLAASWAGRFLSFPQRWLPRAAFDPGGDPSRPGSLALRLAPHLARRDLARPSPGWARLPTGDAPVVTPAPPPGRSADRWAVGLCDVRAVLEPEEVGVRLFVPRAATGRAPGGGGLPTGPILAAPPPIGHATDDPARRAFWRAGADHCLRCGGPVEERRAVDGCRMNGDAWGTVVFHCACGFSTYLRFDDTVPDGGSYYFETRAWRDDG